MPPTINLDNPDEQCDLDYVSAHRTRGKDRHRHLQLVRVRRDKRHPGLPSLHGISPPGPGGSPPYAPGCPDRRHGGGRGLASTSVLFSSVMVFSRPSPSSMVSLACGMPTWLRLFDGCRRLRLPIPDQYLLHDECPATGRRTRTGGAENLLDRGPFRTRLPPSIRSSGRVACCAFQSMESTRRARVLVVGPMCASSSARIRLWPGSNT